jgi:hypothetical protein
MESSTTTNERKDGVVYLTLEEDHGVVAVAPDDAEPDKSYSHQLLIGRTGSIERTDHGPLVSPYNELGGVKVSNLRDALKVGRCCARNPERVYVDRTPGPINEDLMDLDDVYLQVTETQVAAIVRRRHETRPELTEAEYAQSLQKVMNHYGCRVAQVRYLTTDGTPIDDIVFDYSGLGLDPEVEAREVTNEAERIRKTVHDVEVSVVANDEDPIAKIIDAGQALAAYFNAEQGGTLTAKTIVDLLRGGHVNLLLGHKESEFIDVKSQQYNVSVAGKPGEQQKIELAQDVARFANGNTDAVLIMGYEEGKSGKDSVIKNVKEIDLGGFDPARYANILDSKIVPTVSGLTVETVETSPGKGLIYIYVPAQPPEMQPYLVHGVVVEDKIEGAFFSIVQRRGEGSITVTASQIHGYIVAGKAFLRGQDS